jgi:hypothetical protein
VGIAFRAAVPGGDDHGRHSRPECFRQRQDGREMNLGPLRCMSVNRKKQKWPPFKKGNWLFFGVPKCRDGLARVKLTQWLRKCAVQAAWRGALCVIACMRGQKSNAQNVAKNRGSIGDRVRFGYQDRPAEIAELCARYNGGMPANTALIITSIGDVSLPAEATCLLRRAFFDFERITLTPLSGGRSGMGVWRVEAESSDKDLRSPFVVKCGKASEIDEQVNTYRDVVEDRVPYRGCGPLCLERSVRGVDLRLSVSRFVEHATRLDEYILDRDAGEIIYSIYNRVLRRWRTEPSFQKVQLFPELLWRTTWPKYLEKLDQVFPHANQAVPENLLSPQEIFDVLSGGLAVKVPYCRAHDDLNLRNVFVSEARSEAILIDFTRSQKRPLSKDCARLDVGLGFDDELNAKQPLMPVVNQIRTYWWCSPPRIGRQRICPASSTAREIGASFSKDKCVRISL